MTTQKYLIIENGKVKAKTPNGVVHRVYYDKGNAIRADWEDYEKGTVRVQLDNGKMLIISNGGVLLRSF